MTTKPATSALLEQHKGSSKEELVTLADLVVIQLRAKGTDPKVVAEYAEVYRDHTPQNNPMPAIRVFRDDASTTGDPILYMPDGDHRRKAALKVGYEKLQAIVTKGSRHDALLYAARANPHHGARLTIDDRRSIVTALLDDDEIRTWSDASIADHANVSPALVAKLRKQLGKTATVRKDKRGRARKVTNTRKAAKDRAAAKADAVESLTADDADLARIRDAVASLAASISGILSIPRIKCYILAAAYIAYYKRHQEHGLIDRPLIATWTQQAADVHPGQLVRQGLLILWEAGYQIHPTVIGHIEKELPSTCSPARRESLAAALGDKLPTCWHVPTVEMPPAPTSDADTKSTTSPQPGAASLELKEPEEITTQPPAPPAAPTITETAAHLAIELDRISAGTPEINPVAVGKVTNLIALALCVGIPSRNDARSLRVLNHDRTLAELARATAHETADRLRRGQSCKLPELDQIAAIYAVNLP